MLALSTTMLPMTEASMVWPSKADTRLAASRMRRMGLVKREMHWKRNACPRSETGSFHPNSRSRRRASSLLSPPADAPGCASAGLEAVAVLMGARVLAASQHGTIRGCRDSVGNACPQVEAGQECASDSHCDQVNFLVARHAQDCLHGLSRLDHKLCFQRRQLWLEDMHHALQHRLRELLRVGITGRLFRKNVEHYDGSIIRACQLHHKRQRPHAFVRKVGWDQDTPESDRQTGQVGADSQYRAGGAAADFLRGRTE